MTREQQQQTYKDALPAIQAFIEGKTIQVSDRKGIPNWTDYEGNIHIPDFGGLQWQWRVKPEPKLRPWKPEEVPVGALLKRKFWDKNKHPLVILGVDVSYSNTLPRAILSGQLYQDSYESHYFLSDLLTYNGGCGDQNQYSVDHGKTWLPCGILTEE